MSTFNAIPLRTNGKLNVAASWFNVLRTAGLSLMGKSGTAQTNFTILNSQAAVNVTGLVFDETISLSVDVTYHINAANFQKASFHAYYDGANWQLSEGAHRALDAGVVFSITAAGQVQYTSGGASAGTMRYRVESLDVT